MFAERAEPFLLSKSTPAKKTQHQMYLQGAHSWAGLKGKDPIMRGGKGTGREKKIRGHRISKRNGRKRRNKERWKREEEK